ncbi:chalcone isomerase family protein [Halomonas korlensis]|uniref:Chalcone isomerase-like n=1 Tax=Halomonas korlensis TaxID=463301 RepID=A0A1I7K6H9_9GAMM|nr:chalcone isomerase family protein [Halomonas korlensis]SFU93046.1 Chalcone isomerase-like [Halomonas korlensis]
MRLPLAWAVGPWLVLLTFLPAAADSVTVKDASFPVSFEAHDQTYALIGHGLFEYMIWDAYAGAYYQAEATQQQAPLSDVPRHLELAYFHGIDAEDFAKATRDTVRDNLDRTRYARLEAALEDFNGHYRNVVPGDRYALSWDGEQLRLALNDQTLYQGGDPALANALFGIWLAVKPLSEAFRDALLDR